MGIGYLPQEASIFRGLTVEQNIMAVLELVEPNRKRRKEQLDNLLEEFNITRLRKSPSSSPSGKCASASRARVSDGAPAIGPGPASNALSATPATTPGAPTLTDTDPDSPANAIGGYPFVGTPDKVADELANLSRAGVRGIAFSLVNYVDELPYVCEEVLPWPSSNVQVTVELP